jgi:hypothetical protein
MISGIILLVLALFCFILAIISGVQAEDDADWWLCTFFAGTLGVLFLCGGLVICCEESEPKEGTIVCRYYDVKSQQTITVNAKGDTVATWQYWIDYKK